MSEILVSSGVAYRAKELGFNIPCDKSYMGESLQNSSNCYDSDPYAPSQSKLQKWLRDEHDIHIEIIPNDGKWHTVMYPLAYINDPGHFDDHKTFEIALEHGLKAALYMI